MVELLLLSERHAIHRRNPVRRAAARKQSQQQIARCRGTREGQTDAVFRANLLRSGTGWPASITLISTRRHAMAVTCGVARPVSRRDQDRQRRDKRRFHHAAMAAAALPAARQITRPSGAGGTRCLENVARLAFLPATLLLQEASAAACGSLSCWILPNGARNPRVAFPSEADRAIHAQKTQVKCRLGPSPFAWKRVGTHTTAWMSHAAIIDMLEPDRPPPDRMLDQVGGFSPRWKRSLPAFTLSANQPGLFRLERFRAKWLRRLAR